MDFLGKERGGFGCFKWVTPVNIGGTPYVKINKVVAIKKKQYCSI